MTWFGGEVSDRHNASRRIWSSWRRLLLRTLLVLQTALTVWALRVALCAIHLAAVTRVLWSAVDLLRLSILARLLATSGRLVSDRRQLRSAHLRLHHVRLSVARLTLALRCVLTVPSSFLALSFLFGLARVLLLLLLCFPFFANLFELYMSQASQHMQGEYKCMR